MSDNWKILAKKPRVYVVASILFDKKNKATKQLPDVMLAQKLNIQPILIKPHAYEGGLTF